MLRVRAVDAERLSLLGLDPTIELCLRQVPAILDHRDAGGAGRRLHPDALPSDPRRNAEWHRLMDSELRHLFETAQRTLARDLEAMVPGAAHVEFPASHLTAWMSAVNQARILLSELHQLSAEDMDRDEYEPDSPRDSALIQVQVLAYVMQVLVEHALEGS